MCTLQKFVQTGIQNANTFFARILKYVHMHYGELTGFVATPACSRQIAHGKLMLLAWMPLLWCIYDNLSRFRNSLSIFTV